MSSLNINMPANALHANLLTENWERADQEKLGLEVIGESGIPFSFSYQGICSLLWPWLWSTVRKYDNIELLSSSFGHALASHIPECLWDWEIEKGIKGNIPVRFFAEYTHPPRNDYPEEFFLTSQGHYSLHSQKRKDYLNGVNGYRPAIKHGGKIAILMKECLFGKFLESFKKFQANPLDKRLVDVMVAEIKKIGDSPEDEIVICPLDPEAPYTGSDFGAVAVWTEFFEAVEANGLAPVFIKLEPNLDYFRKIAEPGKLPPKDLSKWTEYPNQRNWTERQLQTAILPSTRQKVYLSVGLGSDILAAWWFEKNPDSRVIDTVNRNGQRTKIRVTHNPDIVQLIRLSAGSIRNGNNFRTMFKRPDKEPLLVRRFLDIVNEVEI